MEKTQLKEVSPTIMRIFLTRTGLPPKESEMVAVIQNLTKTIKFKREVHLDNCEKDIKI